MNTTIHEVASHLKNLHQNNVAVYSEQLVAAKEMGSLVKNMESAAHATKKVIKKIEGALKQLGEEPPTSKQSKSGNPNNGPSKQQVKDQVLTTTIVCLEKHGDLSDEKLRESIKKSLPEIDLTGRLRRFSDWLRADERVTEVSPGVWTLQAVATCVVSKPQQAESPANRHLPPR